MYDKIYDLVANIQNITISRRLPDHIANWIFTMTGINVLANDYEFKFMISDSVGLSFGAIVLDAELDDMHYFTVPMAGTMEVIRVILISKSSLKESGKEEYFDSCLELCRILCEITAVNNDNMLRLVSDIAPIVMAINFVAANFDNAVISEKMYGSINKYIDKYIKDLFRYKFKIKLDRFTTSEINSIIDDIASNALNMEDILDNGKIVPILFLAIDKLNKKIDAK